jgi:hypothetical protein
MKFNFNDPNGALIDLPCKNVTTYAVSFITNLHLILLIDRYLNPKHQILLQGSKCHHLRAGERESERPMYTHTHIYIYTTL